MENVVASIGQSLLAKASTFVKEGRLPGAAVGVVHEGSLAWSAGVGFADLAAARPSSVDGLYRIASITKTFTATAIMQLRDEGLLELDEPVVTYLPELGKAAGPGGSVRRVTLRHMLSHESGIQGEPPGADWVKLIYEGRPTASLARSAEIRVAFHPNAQTKYSNLCYQLLGLVVERVSGTAYHERIRARILDPLGMVSTAFEPLPPELAARRATGYNGRSYSDELDVCAESPLTWSEAGLWSSVTDLGRWISFQVGASGGEEVLTAATRAEMHKARYIEDAEWMSAFGIGWYTVRKDKAKWVQHGGALFGFISNVCFDPVEKVGAVVLLNGIGGASTLAMDLAGAARDALRAAVPELKPPAPMPAEWRSLLGTYVDPHFADQYRLEWRDGKLTLFSAVNPTSAMILEPTGKPDEFIGKPGFRDSGELLDFQRGPDGKVRAMLAPGASLPRVDIVP
jgi:D-alanyl-D-alanine carboxypeptidase